MLNNTTALNVLNKVAEIRNSLTRVFNLASLSYKVNGNYSMADIESDFNKHLDNLMTNATTITPASDLRKLILNVGIYKLLELTELMVWINRNKLDNLYKEQLQPVADDILVIKSYTNVPRDMEKLYEDFVELIEKGTSDDTLNSDIQKVLGYGLFFYAKSQSAPMSGANTMAWSYAMDAIESKYQTKKLDTDVYFKVLQDITTEDVYKLGNHLANNTIYNEVMSDIADKATEEDRELAETGVLEIKVA